MRYYSRLQKAFEGAPRLPLNNQSKYVLFSDCHRGTGTSNDNFLKNQPLYLAALKHYYQTNFTYIELGDGDELWENRKLKPIRDAHINVFQLLDCFQDAGRIYLLYGNHDIIKQFLPDIKVYAGIILENALSPGTKDIYLTHGHQVDFLNSTLWPLTRLLVKYLWKPLENFGIPDPTSAAKNYKRKQKTEKRLHYFAEQEDFILIAGHTHRPFLSETDLHYCNCGSCVHPYSITCLEIERMHISLIKWSLSARADMSLYAAREVLSGPFPLS